MSAIAAPVEPRTRPAPDLLPPSRSRRHLRPVHGFQSTLAVDFRTADNDPQFGPQQTSTEHLPDPAVWSQRLVLGLLETISGERAPTQVERWMTLELRERIHRLHTAAVRRGPRPAQPNRVLRIRVCDAVDGVAEVSAVVVTRGRVRAIALRLIGCDGRWLMTELEMG